MNRCVSALATVFIVVLPLSIKPTWAVGVIAIAAGLFCVAGLLRRSLGATLTGCVLATVDLALALWWSAASMSVIAAVAFGLALLLLLDTTHFVNRFAGAEIDPSAWRAQVAWWIARAAICFGAAVLLVVIASALTLLMPASGRPIIGAAGAFAAVAAALWVVLSQKATASWATSRSTRAIFRSR
jgi:hypothetical protein